MYLNVNCSSFGEPGVVCQILPTYVCISVYWVWVGSGSSLLDKYKMLIVISKYSAKTLHIFRIILIKMGLTCYLACWA